VDQRPARHIVLRPRRIGASEPRDCRLRLSDPAKAGPGRDDRSRTAAESASIALVKCRAMATARPGLDELFALFNSKSLADVRRISRAAIISSADLGDVLLFAQATGGVPPYAYAVHFREISSPHLRLTKDEQRALASNGLGPLRGLAVKAANKISQTFEERRLLAAHLFYVPTHERWHLFYFDTRDTDDRKSHWKHGPHIHYSSNFFIAEKLESVWSRVRAEEPIFPRSVHVRFDSHHHAHPRRPRTEPTSAETEG
jgi:hypothetical protein